MKNIAIITTCLSRGGAERAAGQLSIFMSKKYNVYLFVVEDYDVTYEYSGKKVEFHLNKKYEKLKKSKNPIKRLLAKTVYISTIFEMKKMKKKYNIDYSISFLELNSIINIFSHYKDKIIVSVRNNRSLQCNSFLRKLENWAIKKLYNKTYKVVSLSYGVTDDLIKNFGIIPEKIKTIYNFYDVNLMRKNSNQQIPVELQPIFKNNKVILTMGRLVEQKNLIELIKLSSKVLNEKNDTKLVILGRGPQKDIIKKLIVKLKMEDKIFLFDYYNNPFPMIKNAHIFVINSIFEGFCNSIVEAMTCGAFVISTDCHSGPRELIANKTEYNTEIKKFTIYERGILTPVNNSQEMQEAIEYVLKNNQIREKCIKNATKYVESISNKKLMEEWISLIDGDE